MYIYNIYVYPKQPPGLFFIAQLVFFQHSDSPEFIKPPKGLELEAPPEKYQQSDDSG